MSLPKNYLNTGFHSLWFNSLRPFVTMWEVMISFSLNILNWAYSYRDLILSNFYQNGVFFFGSCKPSYVSPEFTMGRFIFLKIRITTQETLHLFWSCSVLAWPLQVCVCVVLEFYCRLFLSQVGWISVFPEYLCYKQRTECKSGLKSQIKLVALEIKYW